MSNELMNLQDHIKAIKITYSFSLLSCKYYLQIDQCNNTTYQKNTNDVFQDVYMYILNGSQCRCTLTNVCGYLGGHHLHDAGIINLKVEPLFPGKKKLKTKQKHTY